MPDTTFQSQIDAINKAVEMASRSAGAAMQFLVSAGIVDKNECSTNPKSNTQTHNATPHETVKK